MSEMGLVLDTATRRTGGASGGDALATRARTSDRAEDITDAGVSEDNVDDMTKNPGWRDGNVGKWRGAADAIARSGMRDSGRIMADVDDAVADSSKNRSRGIRGAGGGEGGGGSIREGGELAAF